MVLRARLEGARPRRGKVGVTTDAERTISFRDTTRAARGLFVKIHRILLIQCSNFVQKTPPVFTFARNDRMWSVALRRQVPFLRYAPRFFQGNGKRALAHEVVRRVYSMIIASLNFTRVLHSQNNQSFCSPYSGDVKRFFHFDCPKANFSIQV